MNPRILLFIFIALGMFRGYGETLTPTIEKDSFFLGEPVILIVPVKPDTDLRATFPSEEKNLSLIRIEPAGDKVRIVLSALETGTLTTPPFVLSVGKNTYEIASVTVTIKPNTTEEETTLRDIKPPVKAYEPNYLLLWIAGGILLVTALFLVFWRLSKQRRKQAIIPIAQKTPYQLALEYRRRAEKQLQEMDYEAFADTVTAGLRHYLELVKRRPFLEMTTGEIRRALKKSDLSAEEAERIVTFLAEADRFKYADEPFTSDRFAALLDEFSRIVERIERSRSVSTTPQVT